MDGNSLLLVSDWSLKFTGITWCALDHEPFVSSRRFSPIILQHVNLIFISPKIFYWAVQTLYSNLTFLFLTVVSKPSLFHESASWLETDSDTCPSSRGRLTYCRWHEDEVFLFFFVSAWKTCLFCFLHRSGECCCATPSLTTVSPVTTASKTMRSCIDLTIAQTQKMAAVIGFLLILLSSN